MLFNSFHFLFFFPIVVCVYFFLPKKIRWIWLLVSSYYFYLAWNPKYGLLLFASTLTTWLSGLLLEKAGGIQEEKKRNRRKKWCVAGSFTFNLAILVFFKYYPFLTHNITAVFRQVGIEVATPVLDVLLPVGISFYTFQALGYTMDVYRGDIRAEKNLARYALFVSFFPQLVAGPIERSTNLIPQLQKPTTFSFDNLKNGLLRMLWGFFEKMVIADLAAVMVNSIFLQYKTTTGLVLWVGVLLFAVQIYCDFSGYTDIAIGAAQILGISLMENFHRPYFATSIRDFWHRWHISLSTWFQSYVYIPLGGNRKGKPRKYLNVMITFLLSGLWHGASWNFVIWGGLHGMFQVMGEVLQPARQRLLRLLRVRTASFSHRLLQTLCTVALVCFAWVFFRAPGAQDALVILRNACQNINFMVFFDGTMLQYGLDRLGLVVLVAAILVLFGMDALRSRVPVLQTLEQQSLWFQWTLSLSTILAMVFICIYHASVMSQAFIYFQF